MKTDPRNIMVVFLSGLAAGAALGLIFAPRAGEETREMLRERADMMREKAEMLKEKADDMAGSVRKRVRESMVS